MDDPQAKICFEQIKTNRKFVKKTGIVDSGLVVWCHELATDWHARNAKLAHNAYSTRNDSHNLRKEAQLLKIETDTKTKWHNYENNMRLSER